MLRRNFFGAVAGSLTGLFLVYNYSVIDYLES